MPPLCSSAISKQVSRRAFQSAVISSSCKVLYWIGDVTVNADSCVIYANDVVADEPYLFNRYQHPASITSSATAAAAAARLTCRPRCRLAARQTTDERVHGVVARTETKDGAGQPKDA